MSEAYAACLYSIPTQSEVLRPLFFVEFALTHSFIYSFIKLCTLFLQFFCVILIVMVAQIAAGAWAFHNRDKLDDIVRVAVKSSVQEEYGQASMSSRTVTFDTLQKNVSD